MKYWRGLVAVVMIAVLSSCGNSENRAAITAPVVPTSPNAAYQSGFPELGATSVTILGERGPEGAQGASVSETPTPEAAPVVTEAVNEEITVSPGTIQIEQGTVTTTP